MLHVHIMDVKNLKYINVKEMRGMYSGFDRATSLEEVKIKEGVTSLCSGIFCEMYKPKNSIHTIYCNKYKRKCFLWIR